jgi:hypothetical protein
MSKQSSIQNGTSSVGGIADFTDPSRSLELVDDEESIICYGPLIIPSLSRYVSNGTKRSANVDDEDGIECVNKRAKADDQVDGLRDVYPLPQSSTRNASSITSARHPSTGLTDKPGADHPGNENIPSGAGAGAPRRRVLGAPPFPLDSVDTIRELSMRMKTTLTDVQTPHQRIQLMAAVEQIGRCLDVDFMPYCIWRPGGRKLRSYNLSFPVPFRLIMSDLSHPNQFLLQQVSLSYWTM